MSFNNLSKSEFIYATQNVIESEYVQDSSWLLRQAQRTSKPPAFFRDLIHFFTIKGETVLDCFAGVGSVLCGAAMAERKAIGLEHNTSYVSLFNQIKSCYAVVGGELTPNLDALSPRWKDIEMRQGFTNILLKSIPDHSIDCVMFDPSYGVSDNETLNRENDPMLAIASNNDEFCEIMYNLALTLHTKLKEEKFLIICMGDRYVNGHYITLAANIGNRLKDAGYYLKNIVTWTNKAIKRPLKPYRAPDHFIPNIVDTKVIILQRI